MLPQEALESEQCETVGCERYQRPAGRGYRNGCRRGYVEGAEGRIKVEVPQRRPGARR
jgi:transposase-like protein